MTNPFDSDSHTPMEFNPEGVTESISSDDFSPPQEVDAKLDLPNRLPVLPVRDVVIFN